MARRKPRNPERRKTTGRPVSLTPRTADVIEDHVRRGNHITTACAAAGVHRATLYSWLQRADQDSQRIERAVAEGHDIPTDIDLRFIDFRDRLADARAHAEIRAVAVIDRAMQGGFIISEEPIVNERGEVQRDDDGRILYKRTYSQPDGRLALSYLGRSRPDVWGQNPTQRVELHLSGEEEGGGAPGATPDVYRALSQRIAEIQADREREDAGEYGEEFVGVDGQDQVYDAELVDDDERDDDR